LQLRRRLNRQQRKGVDSMCMLLAWNIWKERTTTVFRQKEATTSQVLAAITEEGKL
ncbi:hypothetical protein BAE44_0023853, partial [Dichanthelium oligosanthes]